LPVHWIEFIHPAAGKLHGASGCRAAAELAAVSSFEAPFYGHNVFRKKHVLRDVTISRKASDKRTDKLIPKGRFAFDQQTRNLEYDVVSVVRQNPILIGSGPGFEILIDERADVVGGCKCGRGHKSLPPPVMLAQSLYVVHQELNRPG